MFKKKEGYVNEQKKTQTKAWLVGIVMLINGITWTSNVYMFQDLQTDYNRSITIYNTAVQHRLDRETNSDAGVDDVKSPAKEVSLSGDEGVRSPSTVKEQIKDIAQEEGFEDYDLLVDIAFCESSLNPTATNNNSSATGLYQILDMHGLTVEERMDVDTATRWTINKINNGGLSAWDASKHCWS